MVGLAFLLISMGLFSAGLCGKMTSPSSLTETSMPELTPSSTVPECGHTNPNGYEIDDSEPEKPGPFHPLTDLELRRVRKFLQEDPKIRAVKSSEATINSSYIFTADLFLPKKSEVLNFLDNGGPQPERQAIVTMFRGDRAIPVVEECVCGPLPNIRKCELLNRTNVRNPVEFTLRPENGIEMEAIKKVLLKKLDDQIGDILKESYGAKFTGCTKREDCLTVSTTPVATGITKDITKRYMWITAAHDLNDQNLHQLDMSLLVNFADTNPEAWTVDKIYYSDKTYESIEDFKTKYESDSIPKTKVSKPANDENLFSSLKRRPDPQPTKPQRPPRLVEPDGRRYSVKDKTVKYMGFSFNFRMSVSNGPALYNIMYNKERIAYELSLGQIASLHSGHAPGTQTLNEVETSHMMGSSSRAVIPGAGCPETGTSLSARFMNQYDEEPAVYNASFCIFENNNGHPLRRHLSYETEEGGFYGAMLDSALTVRSAMACDGHDYIVDYIFHQNGVIETKIMSTGYERSTYFTKEETPYGHHIQERIMGTVHKHLFQIKFDSAVGGNKNRYEQLEIVEEQVQLTAFPDKSYSQNKINTVLKKTEKDSIVNFNFDTPKYHIVSSSDNKNAFNESRAYRLHINGMVPLQVDKELGNVKSIPWANQQIVVTKRKDDERHSSSIYSVMDSHKPVVDFNSFFEDDEDITDEDLVFWIQGGFVHIPHSEDLPNLAAVGNHFSFTLEPYNYFKEDPSMSSRDAIYISYKDESDPSKGVKVDRNGNSRDQCVLPRPTLEEDLEADPDRVLESRRRNPTDF